MTSLRLLAVLNVGFKYARYENYRKVPLQYESGRP